MRKILFRGKQIHVLPQNEHLNGTWIYGYLCDENYINTVGEDEYGGKFTSEMLVDPETVCQYTGKSDDNVNKIWEEDFVKINDEWIGRVIWRDDVTAFCVFPNDDNEHETYCLGYYIEEGYKVQVIGNIFDNPELIGGQT